MTDQDTRKQLIIDRHIAKMSPEEITRRFITAYVPRAKEKARAGERSSVIMAERRRLASAR